MRRAEDRTRGLRPGRAQACVLREVGRKRVERALSVAKDARRVVGREVPSTERPAGSRHMCFACRAAPRDPPTRPAGASHPE